jgi:uncharacterized protein YgiM (DUF1202 family)
LDLGLNELQIHPLSRESNYTYSTSMNYGICPLSVVPVRSSASDKSEMVTQLLFGETVEILDTKSSWSRIRCTWDNYIGWVDSKQIKALPASDVESYKNKYAYSLELIQAAVGDGYYLPITIGATLPEFDGMHFRLNGSSFTFSGQAISPLDTQLSTALILKIARRYLYAPYLWGGRSPMGIDCSGLSQIVFKMAGVAIPRDASEQVHIGHMVDFNEQAQAGDLAFFENKKGNISHVGILLSKNEIIHASGQVRVDKIDHFGIFNETTEKYTHKLRVIKRLLPTDDEVLAEEKTEKEDVENQVKLF